MKFENLKLKIFSNAAYVLLFGIIFWTLSYHLALITTPIQQEYREGAQIVLTDTFIKGIKPYSFESLPLGSNPYGVLYQVICYYPAKFFGSTFLLHRAISSIFIFASLGLIFLIMRKKEIKPVTAISAICLLYVSFLYGSTALARPDALGELLFLAAVLVPYLKKFNLSSLAFSSLLLFLILLTKLYFTSAFFIVFFYLLLFISKKKAAIYGGLFTAIFSSWAGFSYLFFDTYLNQVIGSMAQATTLSNQVLRMQLNFYFVSYLLVFIMTIFIMMKKIIPLRRVNTEVALPRDGDKFNITSFDKPLFSHQFCYLDFCILVTFSLLCLIWGRNDGGWMGYFYQLLSPFLIIRIAMLFNKNIGQLGALVFLINTGLFFAIYFTSQAVLKDDKDWSKVWNLIENHQNIYGSSAVSGALLQHGKKVYDTGLSLSSWASIYKPQGLEKYFSSKNKIIQEGNDRYCNQILSELEAQQFDLLITYGASIAFKEKDIEPHGYELISTIPISFPHNFQHYELSVWAPIGKVHPKIAPNQQCTIYL